MAKPLYVQKSFIDSKKNRFKIGEKFSEEGRTAKDLTHYKRQGMIGVTKPDVTKPASPAKAKPLAMAESEPVAPVETK